MANQSTPKLFKETQLPHLSVGAVIEYTLPDSGTDTDDRRVTLGAFCHIDGDLYILTYPPEKVQPGLQAHLMINEDIGGIPQLQRVIQLNELGEEMATVWATPHIAAIKLRDQDTDGDRRRLTEAIGDRLYLKIMNVCQPEEATPSGVNVFVGDPSTLVGESVQSIQQGWRCGKVKSFDPETSCLKAGPEGKHTLVNGASLGALVTSLLPKEEGKLDVYGIIAGYEGDVAIIFSLKEALSELQAKHFPQKQISLCGLISTP